MGLESTNRTAQHRTAAVPMIGLLMGLVLFSWALFLTPSAAAQDGPPHQSDSTGVPDSAPTVVQPGAPGDDPRVISEADVLRLESPGVTEADIAFARDMIPHHAQALEMVALIPSRTRRDALRLMGRRIEISQQDEIEFLRRWLAREGVEPHSDHAALMPGMLTDAEMQRLSSAEGLAFERLFLESMIRHHRGALTMVDHLLSSPGAAQESLINQFAAEVWADQDMEIRRMVSMLDELRGNEE